MILEICPVIPGTSYLIIIDSLLWCGRITYGVPGIISLEVQFYPQNWTSKRCERVKIYVIYLLPTSYAGPTPIPLKPNKPRFEIDPSVKLRLNVFEEYLAFH